MFKRKIYVALFTSILAVIGLNIIEPVPNQDGGLFLGIVIYSIYIVPIVFIYGIISSIISDKISFKVKKYTDIVSLGFHALFGLCFIIPYSIFYEYKPFVPLNFFGIITYPITILCIIYSVIFFIIDRILRRRGRSREAVYS